MVAMPAEAEPGTSSAPRPTVVRPRLSGPRPQPGPRTRPVGVRACSPILRADSANAVPPAAPRRAQVPDGGYRPLRLTRRGRLVLTLCAAAVTSLACFAAAGGALAADHGAPSGGPPPAPTTIVVQPGQTLWSIAVRADPHADPRLVVQRIIAINSLSGGSITAGQRLMVPGG
jgi:nucleoid-associated protein YgaU